MANQQKNKKHGRYIVESYSVIEFMHEECDDRLFECIPDSWFVDESKQLCFWPPKSGTKSLSLRAINCERPDDDWNVYECKLVSGGHLTYASGYKFLKNKCSQNCNTSSADDQVVALNRPALVIQGKGSIESVFSKTNSTNVITDQNTSDKNQNVSENPVGNSDEVIAKNMDPNTIVVNDENDESERPSQSAPAPITINQNQNKQQEVEKRSSPKNFNLKAGMKANEKSINNKSSKAHQDHRPSKSNDEFLVSRGTASNTKTHIKSAQIIGSTQPNSRRKEFERRGSVSSPSVAKNRSTKLSHRSRSNSDRSYTGRSFSTSGSSSLSVRSSRSRSRNSRSIKSNSRRSHSRRLNSVSKENVHANRTNLKCTSQSASGQKATIKNQQQQVDRRSGPTNLNLSSGIKNNEKTENKKSSMPNGDNRPSKSNKNKLTTSSNSKTFGSFGSNSRTEETEARRSGGNASVKQNSINHSVQPRSDSIRLQSTSRCSSNQRRSNYHYIRSNSRSRSCSNRSQSSCSRAHSRRSRSSLPESQSSRSRTHSSRSRSRRPESQSSRSRTPSRPSRSSRPESRRSLSQPSVRGSETNTDLRSDVKQLMKFMKKSDQRQTEHERRLNRMEVTINKTFIMVGDLTNTNNLRVPHNGSSNRQIDMESEAEIDEFDVPKLPILKLNELDSLQKELKNRRFRRFLLKHQRDFCTPSKLATDTVTLTKYLKRFVSLDVRCKLTLKEKTKNESGDTLMGDYHRVYLFLIDVMRAGYQMVNKQITVEEVHTALRTVWGRSNQLKNEEELKRRTLKQKRLKNNQKKTRRH